MQSPRRLVSALAIAVIAWPTAAAGQDKTATPPQVITSATVVRHIRPELAIVTVRFSASGRSPIDAGQSVAARADSLRGALQSLGIPRDSLINGSQWYWWRGRVEVHPQPVCVRPPDAPNGRSCTMEHDTTYTVNDAIEIHIRDLSRVGAVIDTALAHHITDISPVGFQAGDLHAVQEDALREATRRARAQAEAIAGASGATLGRIVSLSTQREGAYDPYNVPIGLLSSAGFSGGSAASGTTVIEPSLPVSVTVFGKWELVVKQD
jgi:uncharacterized protein